MDLEDELKRLFADERLDVPVPPDAERTVVAGARRRRRRRVALVSAAGVVAAMVVAAGTITLTGAPDRNQAAGPDPTLGITSSSTTPPSTMPDSGEPTTSQAPSTASTEPGVQPNGPTTTTKTSSGKPPVSVSSSKVSSTMPGPGTNAILIGPTGLGPFRLGMSQSEVVGTGQVSQTAAAGSCTTYSINGRSVTLSVSKTAGLVEISAHDAVLTPENVGYGSTESDVKAKYPSYSATQPTVAVPGNSAAHYTFTMGSGGKVTSVALGTSGSCA